ncbi:hypothetical protein BLNAU_4355 [Blattamonas nauphoetae]|uniref:Uncharacterized protein n=1 Tax=Blattamonas nauphoetae TaxID=2049346 RepID=A0ABQ9YAC6_9EUKA|nr:hypothetical protein BLNAU_4355 [Blattamonas nauphoetae]
MDFLHSFEKRNQMMSRLSNDSSLSSELGGSGLNVTPLKIILCSFLSVFCGCTFPSALTELITIDLDSSPLKMYRQVNPAFYLNHTSIDPKHRKSVFPMDLMFERYLRDKPSNLVEGWPDPNLCISRKFLHTPFVGLHALLLRNSKLNLSLEALENIIFMFFDDISFQDTTSAEILSLFEHYPPPCFFDTLLSTPHIIRADHDILIGLLNVFHSFGVFTASFGACSSLAQIFKTLAPFDSNPDENELNLLSDVGEIVLSLHWLNIPPRFDSPLLCHLPSLAGAQRGVLQTLSSHSGIPSLIASHSSQLVKYRRRSDFRYAQIHFFGYAQIQMDTRRSKLLLFLFEFMADCCLRKLQYGLIYSQTSFRITNRSKKVDSLCKVIPKK